MGRCVAVHADRWGIPLDGASDGQVLLLFGSGDLNSETGGGDWGTGEAKILNFFREEEGNKKSNFEDMGFEWAPQEIFLYRRMNFKTFGILDGKKLELDGKV